ncbi:cytochrome c biogenesis protein [Methanoculleus bourgensis]|jgi:cytochrome c-type biogenesis protein|uniref:urease accessory protein UreH domain-containing protein n=1 Tax=Methanoculleus TaxID=45989 RepID=UPI00183EFB73|nr:MULTISPECIES: cytochrome c biogenesis protein CcdA [Methanoculleus]MBT0731828.1 cytochrome c biogenesis protein [Methanoculleus bourgensis]MDD3372075.1 cytochrome c biogenesis protein CcdA [Methanoculleus bourgensis]NMA88910.1 cytochrome c biogenesis protein [Methanoculleus bourgensis]
MVHWLMNVIVAVTVVVGLIGLIPCASASAIHIEYFHAPGCPPCKQTDSIIVGFEKTYDDVLIAERIDVNTPDGWDRWLQYGFTNVPAVVVNGTIKIPKEEITEESIRAAIEISLSGAESETDSPPINWNISFAYSLGLFSGFSPCLMAILGFILVYTTGSGNGLRSSLLNSMIFGLGLVAAYIVMGCCFLLVGMSLGGFGPYLAVAAGLITVLTGLNLLGLIQLPLSADGYIRSVIQRHSTTLVGLFVLGMIFSIVKAPCAAPMILVLLSKILIEGSVQDLSLLLVFGAGVLTPFVGVGVLGGYGSSSRIREYRDVIKAASGIILIGFGFWIIFWG